MLLGWLEKCMKKNEGEPLPYIIHKNGLKVDHKLKVRAKLHNFK